MRRWALGMRRRRTQQEVPFPRPSPARSRSWWPGSERGYVTYDELNATLPLDQLSSEEIEDTMTMLSELGITVTESDESEEPVAPEGEPAKAYGNLDHKDTGRTDDPVRMYLREMRSIRRLSREG